MLLKQILDLRSTFKIAAKLYQAGVIGINQRNFDYTLKYNSRKAYPLVDSKIKTKSLAAKMSIATPELYTVITEPHQVRDIQEILSRYSDFVIKPSHGSGGEGILVVKENLTNKFKLVNDDFVSLEELQFHCFNILAGMYSLGGQSDQIMIEYRVKPTEDFQNISYKGVPDIRIIVFKGYPVMAMLRLPTKESRGKANLHQGAIGAGVAIDTGVTNHAVWHNQLVKNHPDTGNIVAGTQIPDWDSLLLIAAKCYELSGLGYQALDLVIDQEFGALMLELNARPGLNIQIANQAGLLPRLKKIESIREPESQPEKRVQYVMENFR